MPRPAISEFDRKFPWVVSTPPVIPAESGNPGGRDTSALPGPPRSRGRRELVSWCSRTHFWSDTQSIFVPSYLTSFPSNSSVAKITAGSPDGPCIRFRPNQERCARPPSGAAGRQSLSCRLSARRAISAAEALCYRGFTLVRVVAAAETKEASLDAGAETAIVR
jgi:hypothetical protein